MRAASRTRSCRCGFCNGLARRAGKSVSSAEASAFKEHYWPSFRGVLDTTYVEAEHENECRQVFGPTIASRILAPPRGLEGEERLELGVVGSSVAG